MKDSMKEDIEDDKSNNHEDLEYLKYPKNLVEDTGHQVDIWKMHSPQSSKEQQIAVELDSSSDGDSDEITYICTKQSEDPLAINETDIEPEKKLKTNKRKSRKNKISYDENFTDSDDNENDDDNLHLHLHLYL